MVERAETVQVPLHTRRWRPKGPKKITWMKSLHGVLHGGLWIRFHVNPTQILGDHDFLNIFSKKTNCMAYSITSSRVYSKHIQISSSSSLELVEFETSYIKPNPPLVFSPLKYGLVPHMVHSHFTLCLRVHDYLERLSQHTWYNLWMRVKGPHHYKVAALGSCVSSGGHFTILCVNMCV